MYGYYWGTNLVWWIVWVVIISGLVYWAWSGEPRHARDPALDELRQRFARGDITEDEYRKRLDVLRSSAPPRDAHVA